jgi:hypothetical protein
MSEFTIKDFDLLKGSLLNYVYRSDANLTDYNVGSVMRSLLESVAAEEEEMYFRLWQGVQDAIQQSILQTFDFTAIPGAPASGTVTFGRESNAPITYDIPAGTSMLGANGIVYSTLQSCTINTGETEVTTLVTSSISGLSANIYTISAPMQLINAVQGVSWVKTASQISGGYDGELTESILRRFSSFINSLSRGTLSAVKAGALSAYLTDADGNTTEKVQKASVIEYVNNKGYIDVVIDNGSGSASNDLIDKCQAVLDGYYDSNNLPVEGYKSAGVVANVLPVEPVVVVVTIELSATNFDQTSGYVADAVTKFFAAQDVGQDVNRDLLLSNLFTCSPYVIDVNLVAPAADVVVGVLERSVAGTITITSM